MIDMLEYSPIILTVKNNKKKYFQCGTLWYDYAFDHGLSGYIKIIDFVSFGIACSQLIIPGDKINRLFTRSNKSNDDQTYKEA